MIVRHSPRQLEEFVSLAFMAVGIPEPDAETIAQLMVSADLHGQDGHGIFRLPSYVRRLRAGGVNPRPQLKVINENAATALVDGDNGMGHLVMQYAAKIAMRKAQTAGVGWVGVRNGNHAGPAALYAKMPLQQDMIGIYLAVGSANHMAPWGGKERLLSTNPIAIAVPTHQHPPLVFDMATSTVSYGTVKTAAQRGEEMPEGWMIDLLGNSLRDPRRSEEGLLLPVGNHKGYGLALMISILAGLLNGAAVSRDIVDFNHDSSSPTNTGQSVIAVDVSRFIDVQAFKHQVDSYLNDLKNSERLPGVKEIRIPGERSHSLFQERSGLGIPLNGALLRQLADMATQIGIEPLSSGALDA